MGSASEQKTVSVRIDEDLVEEVDRAIIQAKADGEIPMDYSRSDAVRHLFELAAEDTSLLYKSADNEE
jgi:metal-responsive CopG/Arc/MetJ family transcriptional regulator